MNILLVLPIIIPLLSAAAMFVAWRSPQVQRVLGVIGAASLLAAALGLLDTVWRDGIQVAQMGAWPAPYGITLVADLLSAILVVLTGLMGLAVVVYSLASIDSRREAFGYYPLLHILLMGICGAFLTGDIFNLFVWFEVLLIGSFVLLTLGGERAQMEGALKYVTLNLVSSAIFLTAIGILYGVAGTLNMADLGRTLPGLVQTGLVQPGLVTTLAVLFLVAFGIKSAVFPLFFWLPSAYHTPPIAITAIFAGLLTKVGIYALIRTFTLLFVEDVAYTHGLILIVSGLTMVTGVLGAIAHTELRRILSFLIISHVGFAVMGLGMFTPLAMAGAVFYIIEDVIVLTNLFLISGIIRHLRGSYELRQLGGLYHAYPGVAVLFLIPALSLSGIPPLSGFFAKLVLIQAGLASENYAIIATALVVSLLTLLTVTRIWAEAFWKPLPSSPRASMETLTAETLTAAASKPKHLGILLAPIVLLTALTIIIGLAAEPVIVLATATADQLLNPTEYMNAVLVGEQP